MDKIKIMALGGLDENGRDCYVIEINDDLFVVDAGASLPDKNAPGIDFILPNVKYVLDNKDRLKGYIITHGHDEQMAALKYFYKTAPAPIYCTRGTQTFILGQLTLAGMKKDLKFEIKQPTDDFEIAGHKCHFFQTCHNMAYSCGLCIETDQGNIVYTGDFIVDYDVSDPAYYFDLKALSKISQRETLILMAESKSANKEGYCAPHHRVTPIIEKYFKDMQKRIFISCFWQNFFRIKEICLLAKKYKKRIYFYDMYTKQIMEELVLADPSLYTIGDIIPHADLNRLPKQDCVILMLGQGKELYDKINELSFGDNEDKRLTLGEDDVFISAAVATPTLEMPSVRCIDNLYRTGCAVQWVTPKDITAMHARQDDLKLFLTLLKPKYYFPIRGNFTNLVDNAKLALSVGIGLNHMNIFVIDNGAQICFDGLSPRPRIISPIDTKVDTSPVLVDGKGISTVAQSVLEERLRLGEDGVVLVAASASLSKKTIVAGPDCQMRGFVYVKEAEPLLKCVSEIFVDEIKTEFLKDKPDFENVKVRVKERAKRFIKRENGREPFIIPIINLVD